MFNDEKTKNKTKTTINYSAAQVNMICLCVYIKAKLATFFISASTIHIFDAQIPSIYFIYAYLHLCK